MGLSSEEDGGVGTDGGGELVGGEMIDVSPDVALFREEALAGLRASPKTLPCKYLYDKRGSVLFDDICGTRDYYVTRTEMSIMRESMGSIVEALGEGVALIEPGAGSGVKTKMLLEAMESPGAYVPIEISLDHLELTVEDFRSHFSDLEVFPVCADFTDASSLPGLDEVGDRRVVYMPGSTIGNFAVDERASLLESFAALAAEGGRLLIGVDLDKDPDVLRAAYDDSEGVTAAFNKNILTRINRELDGTFDVDSFDHEARYNAEKRRIEMHLVSRRAQRVRIGDQEIGFEAGESIHTENSHKFTVDSFIELAREAGFRIERQWSDTKGYFALLLFRYHSEG